MKLPNRIFYISKNIKRLIILSAPLIIGSSIGPLNAIIDKTLASQIIEGGVSNLFYATRINSLVSALFITSIITVFYPHTSKLVAKNDLDTLKNILQKSIVGIGLFLIPVSIGLMIMSKPLISIIFGHGAFGDDSIDLTSKVLFYYSIGMFSFGIKAIIVRTFFSLNDTKTPMIISGITLLFNLILNISLSKLFGLIGLPLATSISSIIGMILLFRVLDKKLNMKKKFQLTINLSKITVCSIIVGYFLKAGFEKANMLFDDLVSFMIVTMLGVVIYSLMIYLINIQYTKEIISSIISSKHNT